jgi:lipid A 3-O-deacylase
LLLGALMSVSTAARAGTFSLLVENDTFDHADKHYTSGIKFDYLTESSSSDFVRDLVRRIGGLGPDVELQSHFGFGQSLFTPSDKTLTTPQPNDRPYAGWLYGDYGIIARTPAHVTQVDLEMGVVGPSAGGKWSQNNFHKWLGQDGAAGWATQLPDQFGFGLTAERDWAGPSVALPMGVSADLRPHLGATVGTVIDEAFAGATVRIGNELSADDLPLRVRPSFGGSGAYGDKGLFGWFLFAGASARGVAYNVFLDGDPPYPSNVSHKSFVLDLQWGAAIRIYRFQVTYTMVRRSKEFAQQTGNDRFGALNFSWRF